ncbi:response regulator transcription factor [Sphingomonas crocodyli]|uniref:Response regulator transcription factor n=1 Tax=Sphingomonas crocodyli TaxID=1979270 RepID=A0A437LWJ1_9SPHN|nr:response regulator transcription factor [Sphingomonas crocodyli]RVT89768.1 response regulator transcription factor [Sphingomonas crocodyli]
MGWRLFGYAVILGGTAALLQWLDYLHAIRSMPGDIYVAVLAIGFMALGLWAGNRLTRRRASAIPFERNDAAIRSLGLSPRECELLALLASGRSNKELARELGISPNTVKTHLARLFDKLDVGRRIEAIEKARMLALIE